MTFEERLSEYFKVDVPYYDNWDNEIRVFKSFLRSPICTGSCPEHMIFGKCDGMMLQFTDSNYDQCPYRRSGSTRFTPILDTNTRW